MISDFQILPLYLAPPAKYFSEIKKSKILILNDEERYRKQSLRNHFDILTSQGTLKLTFPVNKPWRGRKMNEIELFDDKKMISNHWKSMVSAYNKSPFFEFYQDDFYSIFLNPPKLLVDLNLSFLTICLKILNMQPEIQLSSQINESIKMSTSFIEKQKLSVLLDDYFGNPDDDLAYRQHFGNEFARGLSILDLIFNQGSESPNYL